MKNQRYILKDTELQPCDDLEEWIQLSTGYYCEFRLLL